MSDAVNGVAPRTVSTSHSRAQRRRFLVCVLIALDFLAITAAGLGAAWVRFGTVFVGAAFETGPESLSFLLLSPVVAALWVAVIALSGLYDLDRVSLASAEAGRVARSLSMGVVALILATFAIRAPGLSRAWVLLTWLLAFVLVLFLRILLATALIHLRRRGRFIKPTLVVGSNSESADIIRVLASNLDAGLVPVGCLASSQAERLELDYCSRHTPVLGTARDIGSVLDQYSIDTVVIASSAFDHDVLARMIAELRARDVDVHISSGLFEVLTSRVIVSEVAGVPLITVKGISLSRSKLLTKRAFDLLIVSVAGVVGLPVWLALATAVKLSSPGPVFYGQERVGRDGHRFRMLKFRSMYQDADARLESLKAANEASGPLFKMRDDPRVTPVGRWMRKFSIDEFPQLINVFRGEMSTVGPRPPLPIEVEEYSVHDWQRLQVTPGMTGLWQVSGRSGLTFDEMVRLDLFYIENWSVGLDLTIILRTIPAVLSARGAY